MSTNQEDQRFLDSIKIVESYEKAARGQPDALAMYINLDSNLSVLRQVVRATEKSMEGMGDVGLPMQIDTNEVVQEKSQEAENSCATEVEEKVSILSKATIGKEKTFLGEAVEESVAYFLGDDSRAKTKEIQETLDECFDCSLRANFSFQLRPVNFLGEILPLIDSLMGIIDNLLSQLEPYDFRRNLCNLARDIDWWCPADLLGIIVAIQGLIKKYYGQILKLTINWTFIIGPLLKFIVDFVSGLMDILRRLLLAPIDCAIGVVSTAINLQNQIESTVDHAASFAKTFPGFFKTESYNVETSSTDYGNIDVKLKGNDKQILGPGGSGIKDEFSFSVEDSLETAFQKQLQARAKQRKLKRAVRDRKKVLKKQNQLVEEFRQDNPFGGTEQEIAQLEQELEAISKTANQPSILETTLFTLNSIKGHINELFGNLLLAVKSLNAWVAGNLGLSIRLSGQILMLLDMIKIIKFIIVWKNLGNSKICDESVTDEEIDEILTKYFGVEKTASDYREELAEYREAIANVNQDNCN